VEVTSVTIGLGETITCTFVNDDDAPSLKLIKHVITDNGGTALASAWMLNAGAYSVTGSETAVEVTDQAGTYALSESSVAGYTQTSLTCDDDPGVEVTSVTIGLGETITCTFVNDDIAPKLIVIKHVINDNGRTNVASDFTMSVTGGNVQPSSSFPGAESPGTEVTLDAGSYSVSETGPAGYTSSFSADCTGTIGVGETKTCTVTNNDLPESQFTDTSFCPLNNNQFRLLYHIEAAPNIYRLQASNPGQFYYNVFYTGTPGSSVTLNIEIPYPFVTQGAVPIQAHAGVTINSSGCYVPSPSLNSDYAITTDGGNLSSSGNPIILIGDYNPQNMGSSTTVTVVGDVPASGLLYVTIHLDYGLKKTGGWTKNGEAAVGSGTYAGITINEPQPYSFSFTGTGGISDTQTPASVNEFKKPAGFLGFVVNNSTGNPLKNSQIKVYGPTGTLIGTVYTDEDGYYLLLYKHKAKSATYTVKLPAYSLQQSVTIKANGFAVVNFTVQ
jgi:hypothetical protein